MQHRSESGQSSVVVLTVALTMAALLSWALVDVGERLGARARAQTAADAAALASSVGPDRGAALRLAGANGAVLVSWSHDGLTDSVTVVVRVGDVTASARATSAP